MKALSQEKQLSPQKINEILNEIKKTDMSRVIFKNSQMYKYFPKYYSTEQMKEEIIELLEKERKTEKTIRLYSDRLHAISWNTDDQCVGSCRFGAAPGSGCISAS